MMHELCSKGLSKRQKIRREFYFMFDTPETLSNLTDSYLAIKNKKNENVIYVASIHDLNEDKFLKTSIAEYYGLKLITLQGLLKRPNFLTGTPFFKSLIKEALLTSLLDKS